MSKKPIKHEDQVGSKSASRIQENMALKAFTETDDLNQIKEIAQLHSKNQAIRTLDKLSHRKEYHEALSRHGLTLDFIVKNMKSLILEANSEQVRLAGLNSLMKSIGMDKYDDAAGEGQNWEELLLDIHKEQHKLGSKPTVIDIDEYDVVVPETPEKYKKMREEEMDLIDGVYDS